MMPMELAQQALHASSIRVRVRPNPNINHKVRADGRPALFEVNTRVGGDLAKDMPRPRAAAFFEAPDQAEPSP